MLTRDQKSKIVDDLKDKFGKADAAFLTNLIGVGANDSVDIRKKLRAASGSVVVTKNTLFRRAAEGTQYEELLSGLKGPHAVAFSFEDPPAVAKVLYDAKKEIEQITLKGGFLGDKALTEAEIEQLAKLPSKDQMLATLLATFNAPVSAFARVMHAIKEQKEEAAEA
jgi:large subunit ribosomal protein L10